MGSNFFPFERHLIGILGACGLLVPSLSLVVFVCCFLEVMRILAYDRVVGRADTKERSSNIREKQPIEKERDLQGAATVPEARHPFCVLSVRSE